MDFDFLSHRKTRINNTVEVEHPEAIREWVLKSKTRALREATTLGQVMDGLDSVAGALSPYGDVTYDLDLKKPAVKGEPLEVLTRLKLVEAAKQSSYVVGAYTGTELSGASFVGNWRNKLGLGDLLVANFTAQPAPYTLSTGSADFSVPVPFPGVNNAALGANVFFANQDRIWASHSLESHGLGGYLAFPGVKFGVEATARTLQNLKDGCSDTVRSAAANPSTKVSLVANVAKGPFKLLLEKAGKPGNSSFFKGLATFNHIQPLFKPFSLETTASAGYLAGASSVLDNFLIGGPGSVYGFGVNSIGPKDGSDFVGAQSFYQSSLSLSSELPWCPGPLRLVGVLNGAAGIANTEQTVQKNVSKLLGVSPSVAASAGLTYRTPAAAFDLLYLHPLRAGPGDVTRSGLYFGVTLNYS